MTAPTEPDYGPDLWSPEFLRAVLVKQGQFVENVFTAGAIAELVRVLDLHRPLDADGQHVVHTPTCGCVLDG